MRAGALIRGTDWAATPLGSPEHWPTALRTALALMLDAPTPAAIGWGPELIWLRNDGWATLPGAGEHGIGQPAHTGWAELWPEFQPVAEQTLAGAARRQVVVGGLSLSSTPLRDESGRVEGLYCTAARASDAPGEDRRRAAEAELRRSEERLRLATENAEVGFWDVDVLNEQQLHWPPRVKRMFGISADAPISMDDFYTGMHPEDRDRVAEAYAAAAAPTRRALYDVEYRTIGKEDGLLRWVAAKGRGIFDAQGRCVRVTGTAVDITARRIAENRLRESEARLRGVLDNMGEGFTLFAPDFTILEMNEEGLRLDGRPREEIVGLTHWDAFPGSADLEVGRLYQRAMAERVPVTLEHCYRWPDGRTLWFDMRAYPTPDGGLAVFWRDVTSRRMLEESVREGEARFRGVFDSQIMGLAIFDARSGETPAINDCFLAMTGHSRVDVEEGRWRWRDFICPDHFHLHQAAVLQARTQGQWDPYEADYQRRDGTRFPVRVSSAPLPGGPGQVVVSVEDIGATRQAEAELRASEQRMQLAKEAANLGVWDWNLMTDAITWTPEMYSILAIAPDAPPSQLYAIWAERIHPDDRDWVERVVRQSVEQGTPFSMDFRIVHPGGQLRWVRSQGICVVGQDGRPVRLTGINIDVTAQHQLEEQLRETAETLAAEVVERTRERNRMFELSSDLFAAAGFDGHLKTINPAWQRLLGYSHEELLGRPFAELIHPDDHGNAAQVIATLERGEPVLSFEDRLICKDGKQVTIAWAAVPEDDRFYVVGRDVTREREREEVLRQTQKMEAMGQLTGGIAHDFNNLLGAVLGGFDLIRRRPDDPDRVRRIAEQGIAAAERGAKLTGQLLAFSRAQRIERKPLIVADLVRGMTELLARTLGPQVNISFDLDDASVPVLSDPVQLEMAVLNLAINARDAMAGGGDLSIRTRPVTLNSDPELAPGDYLELSVNDGGSGMPPEVAARAFDPFYTTKGVGKGTGLGLSQVYGIARQGGGTARIDSRPGEGTTVRLLLPRTALAAVSGGEQEPAVSPVEEPARAASVLVIDDDQDMRSVLEDSLATLGYSVIQAESGPDGLALIEEQTPDLVLVDFAMPGMNGAEVAQAIRARRPELPIVFASGYAETAAIEEAAGPSATILRKPFRIDELQAVIAAALRRREESGSAESGQVSSLGA